jgi:hypothetical protein
MDRIDKIAKSVVSGLSLPYEVRKTVKVKTWKRMSALDITKNVENTIRLDIARYQMNGLVFQVEAKVVGKEIQPAINESHHMRAPSTEYTVEVAIGVSVSPKLSEVLIIRDYISF